MKAFVETSTVSERFKLKHHAKTVFFQVEKRICSMTPLMQERLVNIIQINFFQK